ncbi:MAG TPA: hypothetical protein VFQ44_03565 [Streptosporangiaceae bacterium]|nr:hypothetical protein [Streptosporangiaceae bacterium]
MGVAVAEITSLPVRIGDETESAGPAGLSEFSEFSEFSELAEVIGFTGVSEFAETAPRSAPGPGHRSNYRPDHPPSPGLSPRSSPGLSPGPNPETCWTDPRADRGHGLVALLADGAVRSGREVGLGSGVLSDAGLLPVLPALRDLLPAGALQRGSVVSAGDWSMLSLALAAGTVASGAWCAAAGIAEFGVAAAADAGLDPARLLLVPDLGPNWPQTTASLLDGCDLVLVRPPERPSAQVRRKLEAAVRRYGAVLLVAGDWDGAQVRLRITSQAWAGIGLGHGRLRGRKVQVVADGRGGWSRPQARWLWLPGPDGTVTAAADHPVVMASTG